MLLIMSRDERLAAFRELSWEQRREVNLAIAHNIRETLDEIEQRMIANPSLEDDPIVISLLDQLHAAARDLAESSARRLAVQSKRNFVGKFRSWFRRLFHRPVEFLKLQLGRRAAL